MIILAIETSCDETALALVEAIGDLERPEFRTISTSLFSQVKLHAEHGGVVPMLAKREHQKNLVPLFQQLLKEAAEKKSKFEIKNTKKNSEEKIAELKKILDREQELLETFLEKVIQIEKPAIDAIAVTEGPGLEPALWVGISFARALSALWDIPLIPTNHMEGHICSVLASETKSAQILFPALALLISGGHTELVFVENWKKYKLIGQTRDDAIGEAFDKVARILGLPYPGGPEISKLAEKERQLQKEPTMWKLPRPMINSKDYDFSFAGLKTAVLYTTKEIGELTPEIKSELTLEFENACTEVLITKTEKALEEFGVKTLILGGGVTANKHIRKSFEKMIEKYPDIALLIPEFSLSTDNAVMIGMAGYINYLTSDQKQPQKILTAQGNLKLDNS